MDAQCPDAVLGTCRFCGTTIVQRDSIICYETAEGERQVWASCPTCEEVVSPTNDEE
jgi:hypothetical protein